jgi:hypothetical protein
VRFTDVAPIIVEDSDDTAIRTHNVSFKTPTLTDYVSRVYPIAKFKWTATQVQGDLLAEIVFPDVFYQYRAVLEKLSRFKYMRSSVNISIRLNGTSFHYGKLIAAWSPCPIPSPAGTTTLWDRTENLISVTGFPHVIVSAGMNEVVGLKIPFVYPYNYVDMTSTNPVNTPQSRLFIYVLNTLRCSDVTPDVDVTVFGNLYDITLCGYCNEEPIPRAFPDTVPIIPEFKVRNYLKYKQPIHDGGEAQIGHLCLNNVSQVDSDESSPITLNIGTSPSTSQLDGEMVDYLSPTSLNQIASRPALLASFTMSNVQQVGTTLFDIAVHPLSGIYTSYTNGELHFMTPIRYVSWPCRYWTGALKYKLQIISSNFHSGRVQILYTPQNIGFAATTSDDTAFELTSHIIDIQCDSEIEFEIPWNSHMPALSLNKQNIYSDAGNGTIAFRVLNQLTYKELPVPDIEFNLWVSAGNDFKLYNMQAPITFDLTTPSSTFDGGKAQIAETSKSTMSGGAENIVPFVMGGHTETTVAIEEATLIHAFKTTAPVLFLNEDEQFVEGNLRMIQPTTQNVLFSTEWADPFISTISSTRNVILSFPYYDWYNLMFRFRRGDYIYTCYNMNITAPQSARDSPSSIVASAGIINQGYNANRFKARYTQVDDLLAAMVLPTAISTRGSLQPLHLKLPYSANTKFAITSASTATFQPVYPEGNECGVISIASQRSQSLIFRAAATNMKFYFQVGPPAVFISN